MPLRACSSPPLTGTAARKPANFVAGALTNFESASREESWTLRSRYVSEWTPEWTNERVHTVRGEQRTARRSLRPLCCTELGWLDYRSSSLQRRDDRELSSEQVNLSSIQGVAHSCQENRESPAGGGRHHHPQTAVATLTDNKSILPRSLPSRQSRVLVNPEPTYLAEGLPIPGRPLQSHFDASMCHQHCMRQPCYPPNCPRRSRLRRGPAHRRAQAASVVLLEGPEVAHPLSAPEAPWRGGF